MAPRTPAQKAAYAAAARKRYAENRDDERLRKFIARIKKSESYRPQLATLESLGIDLETVNEIRSEAGFGPISNTTIRGRGPVESRLYRDAIRDKKVSSSRVIASVIPEIRLPANTGPERTVVTHESAGDPMTTLVDIDYLFHCIRKKVTSVKKLKDARNNMERVLSLMGYSGKGSIIPFVNRFDELKKTVEQLKQKNGGEYADASRLEFIYPFSTGLQRGFCTAYVAQLKPEVATKISAWFDVISGKNKGDREIRLANALLPDWDTEVRPVLKMYMEDPATPVDMKAIVALYTQMGGVLRPGTGTDLVISNDVAAAKADKERNYIVFAGDRVTAVLNDHKMGVSRGREQLRRGSSIILETGPGERKWGDVDPAKIGAWLREAAKGKLKLFPLAATRLKLNALLKKLFPAFVFGKGENKSGLNILRKSYETAVYAAGDIDKIARSSYVLAHSVSTALTMYAKDARGGKGGADKLEAALKKVGVAG